MVVLVVRIIERGDDGYVRVGMEREGGERKERERESKSKRKETQNGRIRRKTKRSRKGYLQVVLLVDVNGMKGRSAKGGRSKGRKSERDG